VGRITPTILDLAAVSPDDAIIFFLPITTRQHEPRLNLALRALRVVATCVASPEVRARTVIARRRNVS